MTTSVWHQSMKICEKKSCGGDEFIFYHSNQQLNYLLATFSGTSPVALVLVAGLPYFIVTSNMMCQLNVFPHHHHSFGTHCQQIGIRKEAHQISLCSFLQGFYHLLFKPQISLKVLCNFSHQLSK